MTTHSRWSTMTAEGQVDGMEAVLAAMGRHEPATHLMSA